MPVSPIQDLGTFQLRVTQDFCNPLKDGRKKYSKLHQRVVKAGDRLEWIRYTKKLTVDDKEYVVNYERLKFHNTSNASCSKLDYEGVVFCSNGIQVMPVGKSSPQESRFYNLVMQNSEVVEESVEDWIRIKDISVKEVFVALIKKGIVSKSQIIGIQLELENRKNSPTGNLG